jgi:hypothetical protein
MVLIFSKKKTAIFYYSEYYSYSIFAINFFDSSTSKLANFIITNLWQVIHLNLIVMNRFSILYLLKGQYQHISYPTRTEAYTALEGFSGTYKGIPIGVYDAKTELFYWDVPRFEYNRMSIEEQGKRGEEVINVIQNLRNQEEWMQKEELKEGDILMRPLPLSFSSAVTVPSIEIQTAVESPKKEKRRVRTRRQKSVA